MIKTLNKVNTMKENIRIIILITIIAIFFNGCAGGVHTKKIELTQEEKILPPAPPIKTDQADLYPVGEFLEYRISWNGIGVGTLTSEVKKQNDENNGTMYHIIVKAKSNRFLSAFYKIEDTAEVYVDAETLLPIKYIQKLRHGKYRAEETVTYDHKAGKGSYKSLTNNSEKQFQLEKGAIDGISALYYYRIQDIKINETIKFPVNIDEKNYFLDIKAVNIQQLGIPKKGKFKAIFIKPSAKFKGVFVRKGKVDLWLEANSRRTPLMMKMKAPIGSVYAVLTNAKCEMRNAE